MLNLSFGVSVKLLGIFSSKICKIELKFSKLKLPKVSTGEIPKDSNCKHSSSKNLISSLLYFIIAIGLKKFIA